MSCELTLVRRADISEIMCDAAYMGDTEAARLLHAVRTFEANHRGKALRYVRQRCLGLNARGPPRGGSARN